MSGRNSLRYLRWNNSGDDFRGFDINATPIVIQTLTGWAGLSAVWYGVNLAMEGNNAVAVPWLVIGSLLGISSIWTDINTRIQRSRAWNQWLNEEHGQIREAQSINADMFHQDLERYQNDMNRDMESVNEKLEYMEHDIRRDNTNHIEELERSLNDRIQAIDNSLGDLMRRCDSNCSSKK